MVVVGLLYLTLPDLVLSPFLDTSGAKDAEAIGLPASWVLGYAVGLHTLGIWLGLLTGLAATAILLLRRYSAGLRTRFAAPRTAPATS
ncbi:hypothetical protein [Streptomyces sp. NPDC005336]|uniref:hypothetical protein n=1 Tax=Streptomyces sp. NPDC005336 TaxID=3157035 RepID=UPI0033BDE95E